MSTSTVRAPRNDEENRPVELTIPPKLYGRNREIEALSDAFAQAASGQGLVLLVAGPSGSGKTALATALRKAVLDENGYFLEGKFNQYQQGIPLFAIRQALRQLPRQLLSGSLPERERWKARILEAVGQLGRLLTDLVPELEPLIGPQPAIPEISPYEAPHRFTSVLRSFLASFCQPEHPVVLFLDDWQWADAASLAVLRQLQANETLRYLLVIVSYRDDEVDSAHPLTGAIDELHRRSVPVRTLEVRHLTTADVEQLLADTLQRSDGDLGQLAEVVQGCTQGNPFFIWAVLDFLHSNEVLRFDRSRQVWRWEPPLVAKAVIAGDVVELFARKLRRLPPSCGDLLSLAACIGNRFDVETLALVCGRSVDECQRLLNVALAQRMIQPLDGCLAETSGGAGASGQFAFRHDRVQQAAHSLLAPADVPAVRLRIGRLLASNLVPERLDERLLEVTDHLNAGRLLIQDDAERLQLLELNIAAGHKARAATAYRAALQCHRVAGEFLAVPSFAERFWEQRHGQALQLFKEWAETEFLEGDRAEADRCIRQAVAHARTPLEQADALCVLIVQYTLMAKYPQSIDAARRALAALGIVLPESDFEAERDAEIERVRRHLHNRTVASFAQRPLMTDPVILMATKVLITMGPPCYRSHPRLWSVIVPKVVELTFRYGHIPQAGYSYTGFGGLLGWVASDYAVAREFGALATRLMTEVFRSPSDQSVFYLMIGSSLRHWSEHLSVASQDYSRAWETGLRSGNLQYAAYAMGHNMYCRFYQGVPLARLIQESQQSLVFSRTRTNEWAIDLLEGGLEVFGTLAGTAFSQDGAEAGSEEEYLRRVLAHQNIQVACIYRVLKTFSLLVLREYERALAVSNEAEALIETVGTQGLLPWPEHVFTRFLLLTSLYPQASADRKAAWRGDIDRMLERLQIWAGECAANYSHKLSLAKAEVARLDGHPLEALRLYETAMTEARSGRFIQWEAIACERAADLAEACGEGRLAQVYWQNAYICYRRWGAGEKLRLMEAECRATLLSKVRGGALPTVIADEAHLQDALNARLTQYLDALTDASWLADDDERDERARLIEELTQATANLREEVAERKKVDEALRESEQRFRLVSKATNDAIWDWDLITDSLWWSESFETLFGYRRDEVEQTIESWTARIHPEDRDQVVSSIQRVIDGDGVHWSGEYRYLCKDGKHADVLDRGYVIRDATGKAVRMIGSMTDLTERKNLEARLLQSQKTEAIGRLAGGIAHDFNNLLTVIVGYTEVLMSLVPEGDSKRPLLADIHGAGERAANLTQQLLAFSRKQLLAPRVLDLNIVVSNIEKMLKRLIGEDIHLAAVLAPNLRQVKVDLGQLEQVIINLAVNARDAMPNGGRLTIETRTLEISEALCQAKLDMKPGSYVALTVSDTGCGMPPEVKARLFEPFFTTKEPGKGTGLGLATVFGIVKQSEGLIDVYSEVGVGTRFRILFPAVVEQQESSAPSQEPVRKGSETVLLVEDAEPVRRIAKLALETYGYRVLEATNGREAIHRFESYSSPIDLIITDVVMPEMSGRELVEHLRRHRPGTKVLFMSGYTDDAVVRHGVIQAADAFLQKPFTPMGLARKVREVIEERSTV